MNRRITIMHEQDASAPEIFRAPRAKTRRALAASESGPLCRELLEFEVGQTLAGGRFQLQARLGEGNMGVVFRAFDRVRGELVAIKLPRERGSERRALLEGEFAALRRVSHRNVVTCKEFFLDDGVPFFTMELVEGRPFEAWVRPDGNLDLRHLRSALLQIAIALQALHGAAMVHSDLKPSNVLVIPDGRAVLIDFGMVTYTSRDAAVGPIEAELYGTPDYMAPEQAAGRQPSQASDRYSLGVMLYEALTGKLPFPGRDAREIVLARQRALPPHPSTRQANLPQDLDALCVELMALEPERRPSDEQLIARLTIGSHGP